MPVLRIVSEAWSSVPAECCQTADWPEMACHPGSRQQVKTLFNDRSVVPFDNRTNREDDVVQKLQVKNNEKRKVLSERIFELFLGSILTSVSRLRVSDSSWDPQPYLREHSRAKLGINSKNLVWPFLRCDGDKDDLRCDVRSFKKFHNA